MRIVLLCATRRGLSFLRRLRALCPRDELAVVSFREDPVEPPFLEAIREEALGHGARFVEGADVGAEGMRGFWEEGPMGLMFLVNWRRLVPEAVYRRASLGAVVLHDSLLPAYRGFSPVSWAILNGEARTGATMFFMEREADAGDIIDQAEVPIGPLETIAEVMESVTSAYLTLLERNLEALKAGRAPRRRQDHGQATYLPRRVPADNRIDWSWPGERIHDFIRGLTRPYSGAFTSFTGRKLTVWRARPFPERRYAGSIPGAVAEVDRGRGALVLTGSVPLWLETVELEEEGPRPAAEVLKSIKIRLGRTDGSEE